MTVTPNADRFREMADEIERIERQASTDDIDTKTYPDRTVIVLTYNHGEGDGDV